MSDRTIMPIMGATLLSEIPFAMLAPHEVQAQRNHYQSLSRLAERGGLGVTEAIAILEGRRCEEFKNCIENERYLINKVREWRAAACAKDRSPSGPRPPGLGVEPEEPCDAQRHAPNKDQP